jgi:hypothetical protein
MSERLLYTRIDPIDKYFLPSMVASWMYGINKLFSSISNYWNSWFLEKYKDEIARLWLSGNELQNQKYINAILDNVNGINLFYLILSMWLFVTCGEVASYRNELKPSKIKHCNYIDEVETILSNYLAGEWTAKSKNTILFRFNQLDETDKKRFMEKVALELHHASAEMLRERALLGNSKFLAIASEEDIGSMNLRIDKNNQKLHRYPELLLFLKEVIENKTEYLNFKWFIADFARQIVKTS